MINFCCYFDHNYAIRALVMIDSLRDRGILFKIWVLCLTEECWQIMNSINHPEIHLTRLSDLEREYPKLNTAKNNRSLAEYYFTLSPFWPSWLFKYKREIPSITYIDADIEFFSSPQCLYDEIKNSSIGIIEHRFPHTFDISDKYGKYNVGWIYFSRDANSTQCLAHWRKQCLEWCKDYPQDGKFADQKYLDRWVDDFKNIQVIKHPGANLAPWNINRHEITKCGMKLLSDNEPIVFYHFHMLKKLNSRHIETSLENYHVLIQKRKIIIENLYIPYILKLLRKEEFLQKKGIDSNAFKTTRSYYNSVKSLIEFKEIEKKIMNGEIIRI